MASGEVRDQAQANHREGSKGSHRENGASGIATYVKVSRPRGVDGEGERWAEEDTSPTLNTFDQGDSPAVTLVTGGDLAPTLTAPDARHRVVDGKRQDGSRLDRIPTIVQSLDTKQGGPDDNEAQAGHLVEVAGIGTDDALLPDGLDSHRYRCCGNGVVAPVGEWIGRRLAAYFAEASGEVAA